MFHFGYPPLMPRMYAAGGEELRRLFERAGTAGAVTSLDLCVPDPDSDASRIDWEEVLRNTLQFVDVFAPSIDELLFMLDRPRHQRLRDGTPISAVVDRACLRALADRVIGLGTRIVAIKLGEHGLYVRVSADADAMESICRRLELDPSSWCDRELLSPCFQADRIAGTTGSGDATIAGLLMAMLRGGPPTDAATIATAVGACSVESIDPTSGIPPWPELQTRLEQGWPRHAVALDVGAEEAGRDAAGTVILR
jgi:sugar/nucleoside kinase (ribokinase family)